MKKKAHIPENLELAKIFNTTPEIIQYIRSCEHLLRLTKNQMILRQDKKIDSQIYHLRKINKKGNNFENKINAEFIRQAMEKRNNIKIFLQQISDKDYNKIISFIKEPDHTGKS